MALALRSQRNGFASKANDNELSEELCNDIRAAFNLFDTNQTGRVDIANLGNILRCCGLEPTEVHLQRHVLGLNSRHVTLGQVITVAETFHNKSFPKTEIRRVYNEVFNADGHGINPRALVAASQNMNEKALTVEEAQQMIEWLQHDDP